MTVVQYAGGPCDHRTAEVATAKVLTGHIICGGGVYVTPTYGVSPVAAIYAPDYEGTQAKTATLNVHQFGQAWARLMRTLSLTGPREIRRAQAAHAQLLRLVRRQTTKVG